MKPANRSSVLTNDGVLYAGRANEVALNVERQDTTTQAWSTSPLVSNSDISFVCRGYTLPAGSAGAVPPDFSVTLSKTDEATSPEVTGYVQPTAEGRLEVEVVAVDSTVVDATTPSGQREIVVHREVLPVVPSLAA